jgi:mRNA interferase RelE/StbE
MYQVQYSPRAVRDLENLPQKVARRIATKADALGDNPRPPGVMKMEGEANLYRIRVGNYRIIYQIRDNALVVLVVTIGDRKDVYR